MRRKLILAAALLACPIPAGTFAQQYRKTVTVEVYLPEDARLLIEGREMTSKGPMRRFCRRRWRRASTPTPSRRSFPARTGRERSHDGSTFARATSN